MTLPVLRETRMPAVVIEIGPLEEVVEHSSTIAASLADAVIAWAAADPDLDPS